MRVDDRGMKEGCLQAGEAVGYRNGWVSTGSFDWEWVVGLLLDEGWETQPEGLIPRDSYYFWILSGLLHFRHC